METRKELIFFALHRQFLTVQRSNMEKRRLSDQKVWFATEILLKLFISYSGQFKLFSLMVILLITAWYRSITAQFSLCFPWNKVSISVLPNTHVFPLFPFFLLHFSFSYCRRCKKLAFDSHISNRCVNFCSMFAQYLWSFQSLIQSATFSGKGALNHERKV